jgi:hypothetical protein
MIFNLRFPIWRFGDLAICDSDLAIYFSLAIVDSTLTVRTCGVNLFA